MKFLGEKIIEFEFKRATTGLVEEDGKYRLPLPEEENRMHNIFNSLTKLRGGLEKDKLFKLINKLGFDDSDRGDDSKEILNYLINKYHAMDEDFKKEPYYSPFEDNIQIGGYLDSSIINQPDTKNQGFKGFHTSIEPEIDSNLYYDMFDEWKDYDYEYIQSYLSDRLDDLNEEDEADFEPEDEDDIFTPRTRLTQPEIDRYTRDLFDRSAPNHRYQPSSIDTQLMVNTADKSTKGFMDNLTKSLTYGALALGKDEIEIDDYTKPTGLTEKLDDAYDKLYENPKIQSRVKRNVENLTSKVKRDIPYLFEPIPKPKRKADIG